MKAFKEVGGMLIWMVLIIGILSAFIASSHAARPAPMPERLDIIANTAYSDKAGEFCVVTIGRETAAYLGSCSVVAHELYDQLRSDHPLMAVTVTINGNEINRI